MHEDVMRDEGVKLKKCKVRIAKVIVGDKHGEQQILTMFDEVISKLIGEQHILTMFDEVISKLIEGVGTPGERVAMKLLCAPLCKCNIDTEV